MELLTFPLLYPILKGEIFMNMKEIIGNIDETMDRIDEQAKAYECSNKTLDNAFGNFDRFFVDALSGKLDVEESTNAHKANKNKEDEPEVLHADAVIGKDGEEIKL